VRSRPALDLGVRPLGLPRPLARPLRVELALVLALVARLPPPLLGAVDIVLQRLRRLDVRFGHVRPVHL
jgi:hypothetical protein